MIGLSGQRLDLAPGLGLRVPKWLNLTQLELEVYTDNESAIQLYKKFGFTIESTLAQFAFRDGQYVDSYTMARLRQVESRSDR
jgi:RimJ/RimL family protein N-acetyltransferase